MHYTTIHIHYIQYYENKLHKIVCNCLVIHHIISREANIVPNAGLDRVTKAHVLHFFKHNVLFEVNVVVVGELGDLRESVAVLVAHWALDGGLASRHMSRRDGRRERRNGALLHDQLAGSGNLLHTFLDEVNIQTKDLGESLVESPVLDVSNTEGDIQGGVHATEVLVQRIFDQVSTTSNDGILTAKQRRRVG